MKIQVLAKTDTVMRFVIEGSTPQFVNSLRRVSMAELPVLAVKNVDFIDNSSALYDEVIAHRLGLMPLAFNKKSFNFQDACKCEEEGCSNCQIIMVLDKKGPGMVYAKDFKSEDPEAANPLYPDTPIVELFDGQRVKLEVRATLGYGKDHSKYQGAVFGYKYYPVAEVDGNIENPDEVVKACSHHAISISGNKVSVSVDCEPGCDAGVVAKPKGSLTIGGDPSRLVVVVESVSGYSPEDIVVESLNEIKKRSKEFGKQAGKL